MDIRGTAKTQATEKRLRPFFPYCGSKWNIARHYPKPEHDLVVEPFAGSAGYATFSMTLEAAILIAKRNSTASRPNPSVGCVFIG